MPARTSPAARPEAAKRLEFLDVKGSPFILNIADVVKPAITDENGPSGASHDSRR